MFDSIRSACLRSRSAVMTHLLATALLASCSAAGDGVTTPTPPTTPGTGPAAIVDMSTSAVALGGIGSTEVITAVIRDASGRTISAPSVTWSSENPTIAEVAGSGVSAAIVARAPGTTRIKATSGNAAAYVDVRVLGVKSLSITPSALSVRVGDLQPLRVSVAGDAGASQSVRWATLNPSIATVDASGIVTGVGLGTTTVRVTSVADPSVIASAAVSVTPARSVAFGPGQSAITLHVGDIRNVPPEVDVDPSQSPALVWSSGNVTVATVDATGNITAVGVGTAIVRATLVSDPRAQDELLVTVLQARRVTITPSSLAIGVQQQGALAASVSVENGVSTALNWTSSDPTVVSVSANGVVTGFALGVVTVTATLVADPNVRGTAVVSVTASIQSVTVSPNLVAAFVGDQDQLTATVQADGPLPRTVTWRSSNPAVATVSANGLVSSLSAGSATITAVSTADTTKRGTAQVTVQPAPVVGITPSQSNIAIGEQRTLNGRVTVAPGLSTAVIWRSSNSAIATITSSGTVTGQTLGTVTITMLAVADTSTFATATVTVIPIVHSVAITPTSAVGFVGDALQLSANVVADGSLSRSVSWRSSNPTVATVNASGVVQLASVGSALITAVSVADTTKRATAQISATAPSVQSVSLTPAASTLFQGQTVQLNATVVTSGNAPTTYTLRSSDPTVASVNAAGVVTALTVGSSTVTAVATADTTKRASATIVVAAAGVQRVSLTPAASTLLIAQTTQLAVSVTASGNLATTYTLRSSNPAVASVNASGVVTGVAVGTSTITALSTADTTKRATSVITVAARPVSVVVSPAALSLAVNQTQLVTATVTGDPGVNTAATWNSSASTIATVNSSGLVTAVASGSALIIATSVADPSRRDTAAVTVSAGQLATSWAATRLGGALYEDVVSNVGFGASAAFAVNVLGDVYRYDGTSWILSVRGAQYGAQFLAVHGSSASNVIAVGTNGVIARFDGSSWSAMASGTSNSLMDVWVEAAGAAFAVGASGTALRLSGTSWSNLNSGSAMTLNGVWSSGGTAFVAGNAGEVLRFSGGVWTDLQPPTSETLYGVAGTSASNVVVVGTVGTVMRFNGTAWTIITNGVSSADLYAVDGSSANGGRMLIAGDAGVLQLDGSTLSQPSTPYRPRLYAMSVDAAGVTYAGGQRGIVMRNASGTWITTNLSPDLLDVWSTSATNAWAVGEFGFVYRWNGSAWSRQSTPTTTTLNAVWGASASDAFAGGENGTMLRFNGSSWTAMTFPSTATISAVWGSSASDVYAVTATGEIVRFNGSTWSITATAPFPLWGVYGLPSGEVYVSGENGTVMRFNGSGWTSMAPATNGTLVGLWGSSSSNLLSVGVDGTGSAGVAYRFGGSAWSTVSVGTSRLLTSVWGPVQTDVYVAGELGTMLRFNGVSWQTMSTGTTDLLWSVTGAPSGAGGAFAVGYNSTLVTGTGQAPYVAASQRNVVRSALDPSPIARSVQHASPVPDGAARRLRKGAPRMSASRVTLPQLPVSIKFRSRSGK